MRPRCPLIDNYSSGIRFSTFRLGQDPNFPHLRFTSDGEVAPNLHSRALLSKEDPEIDGFKFTMNATYRKALMPEFTESSDGVFESRYAVPPPPVPHALDLAGFNWAISDTNV